MIGLDKAMKRKVAKDTEKKVDSVVCGDEELVAFSNSDGRQRQDGNRDEPQTREGH